MVFISRLIWLVSLTPCGRGGCDCQGDSRKLQRKKIHGNHRRSSFWCVIGIRSFTTAALQCGNIPVRPVGTPTVVFFPPLPAVGRRDHQVVKSIIDGRGAFFQLGAACHRGDLEKDEELRPNAVYAHDPVLIPEQARTNMAACTTTERGG